MIRIVRFIIVFITFFYIGTTQAQPPANNKNNKDFFNIKAPAIEYTSPNPEDVMFEDEFKDSSGTSENYQSVPVKEPNMLEDEEDTAFFEDAEGELSVVEVDEQVNMDSVWVTIAQYYAIWDSHTINPYKIDGADYKDTTTFILYDSTAGYRWSMPLAFNKMNSRFGMRKYRWHYGTDLDLEIGEPVKSVFDGIIRIVQYDARGYGRYVVIRHYNGLETLYGHLSAANVAVGQLVKAGEVIGKGGSTGRSTGPHLHFEVRYEGNAFNAESIWDFPNNTLIARKFQLVPSHFQYLKEARKVYYHSVRSGETLGSISRKYRVSVSQLCKLNRISTRTVLRVGRKLRIR
ncbi:MAG TPA: M23 family metallopeptidase [Cytophagaceae bacterium]|jgi:murein DD-endopeptidase MepM/ murein hydrolase activator NlpD|nr:M23 family metallopeptidase [Cytophagaceae bacterium]